MKYITLSTLMAAAMVCAPAIAQNAAVPAASPSDAASVPTQPQMPIQSTGNGSVRIPVVRPGGGAPPAPQLPSLKENMTLSISSDLLDGIPIAFTLTGVGPKFTTTVLARALGAAADDGIAVNFNATVTTEGDAFKVEYSLKASVPSPVTGTGTMSVRYSQKSMASTVLLKTNETFADGTPTSATDASGKIITLKISKAP